MSSSPHLQQVPLDIAIMVRTLWLVWNAQGPFAFCYSSDVHCPVLCQTSCQLHRNPVVLSCGNGKDMVLCCAHFKRCRVQQLYPADILTSSVCVSFSLISAGIVQ